MIGTDTDCRAFILAARAARTGHSITRSAPSRIDLGTLIPSARRLQIDDDFERGGLLYR